MVSVSPQGGARPGRLNSWAGQAGTSISPKGPTMNEPTTIDLRDATLTDQAAERLLNDLGAETATLVREAAKGRARRRILAVAAAVTATAAIVSPATAQAAPVPTVQPVQVVISGRYATLKTTVMAPAILLGSHCVAVSMPTPRGQVRVGAWCSGTSTVNLSITLPAASFKAGVSTWMVRDLGDGKLTTLTVQARQASRFTQGDVIPTGMNSVYVYGHLAHYKAGVGVVSSQLSPVWLQVRQGGQWVTVDRLVTDMVGHFEGLVAAPAGLHTYRLYRPAGVTVTEAATRPVAVNGADIWDL